MILLLFFCLQVCSFASAPTGLCRPESWPPERTRARPLWFFIRWSWWAVAAWGSLRSRCSLCTMRWDCQPPEMPPGSFSEGFCVVVSLWRTTSPPRQTATGRKWSWMARTFRLTSWTRQARRTTPPFEITTSAVVKASCWSFPSQSTSPSQQHLSSGVTTTVHEQISWLSQLLNVNNCLKSTKVRKPFDRSCAYITAFQKVHHFLPWSSQLTKQCSSDARVGVFLSNLSL